MTILAVLKCSVNTPVIRRLINGAYDPGIDQFIYFAHFRPIVR